jgi:general stress protein YciG
MDPEKQRRIASKGGKAAHAKGRAHEWTVDEAREAGRKGGSASHRRHEASEQQPPPMERQEPTADENVVSHSHSDHA